MADLIALLQPRILDRESFDEFVEDLEDLVPGIERDIATLRTAPDDRALIARLFRSLHTIKGDAAICKVPVGVMICHPIESLLSRCRDGVIAFSSLLAELILLAMDRLELTVEAMASGRDVRHLNLPQLVGGMEGVSNASASEIEQRIANTIEAVTGFRPMQARSPASDSVEAEVVAADGMVNAATAPVEISGQGEDRAFFRSLALQLESRSPHFKGRTDRVLHLAQETNRVAGMPVDPIQLEAAVYVHDVGMMFAPESVWLKVGRLSTDEKQQLQAHPLQAAGLLQRMPGWALAAEIVAQHHEMPDGGGYPAHLKAEAICPGAKILAIVDAFESVTLKHSDRGQTRSLVRAIAEVNACDNQFASEWIGHFNSVIRKMVES